VPPSLKLFYDIHS